MPIERTGLSGHCPDDSSKEIGVPREFQLEHPAGAPKDARFTTSVFDSDLESITYGVDYVGDYCYLYTPNHVLSLRYALLTLTLDLGMHYPKYRR